jgi:hypothetical protein
LTDYPGAQQKVEAAAYELWGDKVSGRVRKVGAGRVIWGQALSGVIEADGFLPDVEFRGARDGVEMDWVHRCDGHCDVYFVANLSELQTDVEVAFRVSGRVPELWDAVTGGIRELEEFHVDGARTVVPLRFDAKQSAFVVFRKVWKATGRKGRANVPARREVAKIVGPWQVSFDPKWGGPQSVEFAELDDWSKRPEDSIRYYSGMAIYRKRFIISAATARKLYLQLGVVKNVAQVRINGHDAGIVWTAPWQVDIKDFVRIGENDLEIEVVNLWPNRLIGDASLPSERRLTKTNVTTYENRLPATFFCAWDKECEERKKNGTPAALLSSGLLGPVLLLGES